MTNDAIAEKQDLAAAARPERKAEGRAWVRELKPQGMPQGTLLSLKGGPAPKPRPRVVYVRELDGGGCLMVDEAGNHKVKPMFHPPEGEGWTALHDESALDPSEKAGNRHKSHLERKEAAREGQAKKEREKALNARAAANRERSSARPT